MYKDHDCTKLEKVYYYYINTQIVSLLRAKQMFKLIVLKLLKSIGYIVAIFGIALITYSTSLHFHDNPLCKKLINGMYIIVD